jgi:hypothetical protein
MMKKKRNPTTTAVDGCCFGIICLKMRYFMTLKPAASDDTILIFISSLKPNADGIISGIHM